MRLHTALQAFLPVAIASAAQHLRLSSAGPKTASHPQQQKLRSLKTEAEDVPADAVALEISSIAKDYYDRPPEHETQGTDEDGNHYDLELPRGTGILETGSTVVVEAEKGSSFQGGGNRKVKVKKILRQFGGRRGTGQGSGNNGKGQGGGRGNGRGGQGGQRGASRPGRRLEAGYYGERSAMVLMIRFTEVGGAAPRPGGMDTALERKNLAQTVNNTLFGVFDHASGGARTHAGVWEECSYGQLSLGYDKDGVTSPSGHFGGDFPNDSSDIFYVDVPIRCSTVSTSPDYHPYCTRTYNSGTSCGSAEFYGWPEYARNYLEANVASFSWTLWQHKVIIFDTDAEGACGFVGMGQTGCSSNACYTWIPHSYAGQVQDYTHELGHNLNLAHAGLINDNSNSDEYGDFSCAMGFCCSIRCYNAPHAYELGHLLPSFDYDTTTLNTGNTDHVLNSMSATNANAAITIEADWEGGDGHTYWIQFKTADSYDAYMSGGWRNNVQIKRWDKGTYEKSRHLAILSAGQSWSDPSNEVTVTANSIDVAGKTADITINRFGACTSHADCDDGNSCTSAICEDPSFPGANVYGCVVTASPGCCGNSLCETGEDATNCPADCVTGPFDLDTELCTSCYIRDGQMFDVEAKSDIAITSLKFYAYTTTGTVKVFTKQGTWNGFQTNQGAWTEIVSMNAPSTSWELHETTPFSVSVDAGATQAFYVTYSTGGDLLYSNNGGDYSTVSAEDDNLKIFQGPATNYWTGWLGARTWNGEMTYMVEVSGPPAPITSSPTSSPTSIPTKSPVTASPTKAPITSSPTKLPTASPTSAPVTDDPTSSPTSSPTSAPVSHEPTGSPVSSAPVSVEPTDAPVTSAPVSASPTSAPATDEPTDSPVTSAPVSAEPTGAPVTDAPASVEPTDAPVSSAPVSFSPTKAPVTDAPTDSPVSDAPASAEPTDAPVTSAPVSSSPTSAPVTDAPTGLPTPSPSRAPSVSTSSPTVSCETLCCFPVEAGGTGGWANAFMLDVCAGGGSEPRGCYYETDPQSGGAFCTGDGATYWQCMVDDCGVDAPTAAPVTDEPTDAPVTDAPTAAPAPAVSAYYVACGASHQSCGGTIQAAAVTEKHEVRCCSDVALSGWTKRGSCQVWGESILGGPRSGCYDDQTYAEAESICADNNGRLCTKEELLADCTRGTGCSHDRDMIWSSSPVVPTESPTKRPTNQPSSASPTVTSSPTKIGALGETGRIAVSHQGVSVATRYVYVNPVVVAFVNTRNEGESVDVRVKDVTSRSFTLFLEEPAPLDNVHNAEQVSYIVMEEGTHTLDGGLAVQAGLHTTTTVHRGGNPFVGDTINFSTSFSATPAVLATLNTYNNGQFMSSLTTDVTLGNFEIGQEALETNNAAASESIGWVAFEQGAYATNGGFVAGYAPSDGVNDGIGQTGYTIDLTAAAFGPDLPDLVVNVYGENGSDGSYARGAGTFSTTAQSVYAEEDVTKDSERNHASEPFAWVGFGHDTDLFEI